jgi:4-hydroxy-3-methylbut-2-enyl diphosphate reductase
MSKVEIDRESGFCFGVVNAIKRAEAELETGETLYCLGDIVHNAREVERLNAQGLVIINREQFESLRNAKVLLRAHGEPPSTYETARRNHITIIDATCPVVLQLQRKIKRMHTDPLHRGAQILIFGQNGHAEVNGLVGQTNGEAIVIENESDLSQVDFNRDMVLFAQTTKGVDHFAHMTEAIRRRTAPGVRFESYDTICRQVANRLPAIRLFAAAHDVVLFVSGKKSSNGRVLFEECCKVNPRARFITDASELRAEWLAGAETIGVCGATSTPKWLMEQVAARAEELTCG